ncbi:MAG: DUF362 domain-containing protein [Calditrichia bacterium]
MKDKLFTRREFLKDSSAAAVGTALYLNLPDALFAAADGKSRVVLIRDENVLDEKNRVRYEVIRDMLDTAVVRLLDAPDAAAAWKKLVRPDDVVGIKTNSWNYLPTPAELERCISERVQGAGVPEKNISIRDRGVLSDPIFKSATALINTRPMRAHHWAGVGTLLKNYILFVPRPSDYHPDSCADLASIWKMPLVKGKTRLNILVMLTPLFHGVGPHNYSPQYVWAYKGLLAGIDPVAVDSVGLRIIQAKRKAFFGDDRPLNPPAKHIALADTRHHLGTADPARIELIKLGWQEDLLI